MFARRPRSVLAFAAVSFAALLGASGPFAADRSSADAQARYQEERARCLSGQSYQDRETCLREAGAALMEARRGTLTNEHENYEQNALQRCRLQPVEERDACVARMSGLGNVTGSIEEGGFIRESRELIIGDPAPAAFPAPQDRAEAEPPVHVIIVR